MIGAKTSWIFSGIHAFAASPPHAWSTCFGCTWTRSILLAPWQLLTVRDRSEVLAVAHETLDVEREQLGEKGLTRHRRVETGLTVSSHTSRTGVEEQV